MLFEELNLKRKLNKMDEKRTNEERTDEEINEERLDLSKTRGHPHGFKDIEKLKELIKDTDKQIWYEKQLAKIDEKKFELMTKYPKKVNIDFEYEGTDEWTNLAREYHALKMEPTLIEHEMQIKSLEDRKEGFEKMIETAELEKDETKELKEQIKNRKVKEDGNGK